MSTPLASVSLLAAFGAGVLSFLSPCVVPLVPGYLSYLAGMSLQETQRLPSARWQVSRQAIWFVLGSIVICMVLGTAAVLLGSALNAYQEGLQRIGGLFLIIFGIALAGLLRVPWVSDEHRIHLKPGKPVWWRSALAGLTFGACWSACTGPILGAILVLTTVRSLTPMQGVLFVLPFAIGQGVPFLLTAVLIDRVSTALRGARRFAAPLTRLGGVVLILLGAVLVSGIYANAG
ncbi:MAG: cytochrome c biogenesis CcdA family protein [Chloroflexota bacterium]